MGSPLPRIGGGGFGMRVTQFWGGLNESNPPTPPTLRCWGSPPLYPTPRWGYPHNCGGHPILLWGGPIRGGGWGSHLTI